MFFLVVRNSSNKRHIGGAALIQGRHLLKKNFFVPDAALIRERRLIEGGTYSSKYGKWNFKKFKTITTVLALLCWLQSFVVKR